MLTGVDFIMKLDNESREARTAGRSVVPASIAYPAQCLCWRHLQDRKSASRSLSKADERRGDPTVTPARVARSGRARPPPFPQGAEQRREG
jgi:hypothetical protein